MPKGEYPPPYDFTPVTGRYRCESVDGGDRCQLLKHDDDQHVACVRFELSSRYRGRNRSVISEYRTWGAAWTKPEPGVGGLRWVASFPSDHERRRGGLV